MINVSCTQPHVRHVINSTLARLQTALDLGGITTNLKIENLIRMKNVNYSDKTDGSDPTKRETFQMHTLKTLAPYRINVENGI